MEQMDKKYITGFNSGYILAKYEPGMLSALLQNIRPITPYVDGLQSGKAEYELELTKERLDELDELAKGMHDLDLDV